MLTFKNGQLQAERVAIGALSGAQLAFSGRMSGGLEKPVVSAKMKLAAQELTPFLDMIGRHSAAHPALARLIEAGPYYSDAAFDVTLTAGNKEGNAPFTFGVIGTANGGKIAASYQAPDLAQALAARACCWRRRSRIRRHPFSWGRPDWTRCPSKRTQTAFLP